MTETIEQCHLCGALGDRDDVTLKPARLGDVAGQVTAIADQIVPVCQEHRKDSPDPDKRQA